MDAIDVLRAKFHKGEAIDIVLLDYHMPHMSGIDVARAMQRGGFNTKIIALSSNVDTALANEPLIHAFCAKPIRRAQLLHVMRSLLRPRLPSASSTAPKEGDVSTSSSVSSVLTGACVLLVEGTPLSARALLIYLSLFCTTLLST